jgi:DUF971 family protein
MQYLNTVYKQVSQQAVLTAMNVNGAEQELSDIKLRILSDPADVTGTGLGYQIIDTALQLVC